MVISEVGVVISEVGVDMNDDFYLGCAHAKLRSELDHCPLHAKLHSFLLRGPFLSITVNFQ